MAGRPSKEADVDGKVVQALAAVGCTVNDIALYLGVAQALVRKYAFAELNKGRGELAVSLKRKQVAMALDEKKPNATMLIWLGKQYLGQTEKTVVSSEESELVRAIIESRQKQPAELDSGVESQSLPVRH